LWRSCARSTRGLNRGIAGNVSIRHSGMLITPSGLEADSLSAADIVTVDAQGM
jgi:ribulose-5-phosphate 4-epimerase/fuculose-1-phosphate aldolase